MDENALLELCTNLVAFGDAQKAGKLCATVVGQGDHLLVVTTDRDKVHCGTIAQVVNFLVSKGIQNDTLAMPDWRQGEIAPSAGEQIQIRAWLRTVTKRGRC